MVGDHNGVRDFDINQTPKTEEDRDEWIMIGATPHVNEGDSNSGGLRRKKLRLTKEQSHLLEESFIQNHTLTPVSIYYTINGSVYVLLTLKKERRKRKKKELNFLMIKSANYVLVG